MHTSKKKQNVKLNGKYIILPISGYLHVPDTGYSMNPNGHFVRHDPLYRYVPLKQDVQFLAVFSQVKHVLSHLPHVLVVSSAMGAVLGQVV